MLVSIKSSMNWKVNYLQVVLCANTLVAGPREHRSVVRPLHKAYLARSCLSAPRRQRDWYIEH